MCFAQTNAAVQEKRVVGMRRVIGYCLRCRMGEAVGVADNEGFKNVFGVQVAFIGLLHGGVFIKQLLLFALGRYSRHFFSCFRSAAAVVHGFDDELDIFAHNAGQDTLDNLSVVFFQHCFKEVVFDSYFIVGICHF